MEKKEGALVIKNHDELIKNPMLFLENLGCLTPKQGRIIINIIDKLQTRISEYLDHIHEHKASGKHSLFSEDELNPDGSYSFFIQYSELGIDSSDYDKIDEAAKALSSIVVPIITTNQRGDVVKLWKQMFPTATPVNGETTRRRYEHRKSYFEIQVPREITQHILNMRSGYSEHLRAIYTFGKCSYSMQLLNLMYNWFRDDPFKTLSYDELRRLMGMNDHDLNGNVVSERYTKFKDFKRRVLEPAKEDADRMWNERKTHFTFDYRLVYKGNRTSGKPDEVVFHMNQNRKEVIQEISESKLPELSPSFRRAWNMFLGLAKERVGESTVSVWCEEPLPLIIMKADRNGIVLSLPTKLACESFNNKILIPCKEDWINVFKQIPPRLYSRE